MNEPGFSGTGPDEPRPDRVVPKELVEKLVGASLVMYERMVQFIPVEDIEIGSFLLGAVGYALGGMAEEDGVLILQEAGEDIAGLVRAARGEDPTFPALEELGNRFREKLAEEEARRG